MERWKNDLEFWYETYIYQFQYSLAYQLIESVINNTQIVEIQSLEQTFYYEWNSTSNTFIQHWKRRKRPIISTPTYKFCFLFFVMYSIVNDTDDLILYKYHVPVHIVLSMHHIQFSLLYDSFILFHCSFILFLFIVVYYHWTCLFNNINGLKRNSEFSHLYSIHNKQNQMSILLWKFSSKFFLTSKNPIRIKDNYSRKRHYYALLCIINFYEIIKKN